MTEEPKATEPTTDELVAACRAAHQSVCDALDTLVTQDEYDTDSEITHAVRWLTQTVHALSRYIQANAPDRAAPVRETEENPEPEPAGPVPPEPEPNPEPVGQVPAEPERT